MGVYERARAPMAWTTTDIVNRKTDIGMIGAVLSSTLGDRSRRNRDRDKRERCYREQD
jgi:hypothetical protein